MTSIEKTPAVETTSLMVLPTYTGILKAMTDKFKLTQRESQLKLAEHVNQAILSKGICCIEAPTGTGKTLGYLAGALAAQAHSGTPIPIVVATATVGLQEQILRCDIPRLAAVGAIDPRKVAVAKGRGRYFCPRTAALLEDKKMQDSQLDLLNTEKVVAEGGTRIALEMLSAWKSEEWDGDKDSWQGTIPSCWEANCGASSDTCVNRSCEYFDKCPYMASRAKLGQAQVIIANHDMVLADLAQRAEDLSSSTALPPKAYSLIFDEAHNLPEKAVATRRAVARVSEVAWLKDLEPYGELVLSLPVVAKAFVRAPEISPEVFTVKASRLLNGALELAATFADQRKFNLNGSSSWGLTLPEDDYLTKALELAGLALEIFLAIKLVSKALTDYAEEAHGPDKAFATRLLSQTHGFQRQIKDIHAGLDLFCAKDRLVRWLSRSYDGKISINTQPLEGHDVLTKLLWNTGFSVSMVSATLQIGGSFKRFADKCGLPGGTVTDILPPVFDYTRGFLHLPTMSLSPSDSGYESLLVNKIEALYDRNVLRNASPGMLILFTSRESMRRVTSALKSEIREIALIQDNRPVPELVAMHKERIDSGLRSILFGLDSMSEGLDLPGKYCGHVVITRLPFTVPGDPVEEARRLHLGKLWFETAYLADMLTMLIQAVGRLIRREDDHGVITVLDNRLSNKRYSQTAIRALPNFTRGTKIDKYFEMALTRGFNVVPERAKQMIKPAAIADKEVVLEC